MAAPTWHNTIGLKGAKLQEATEKNQTQEDKVLEIFRQKNKPMTYVEVHEAFGMLAAPEQSIKRAITNLKTAGKLIKTHQKKEARWGRMAHCYQLA